MDAATLLGAIVSTVGGILLGVVSYFLKRTITMVDQCQQQLRELKDDKAAKAELTALKADLKERVDKLSRDIEGIKEDYITKEDFYREQAKTDRKLDRIIDILMGRKENGNG